MGFPVELRQVFLNLINNAVQAMPEGGVLGIRVREATDWSRNLRGALISVIDSGQGIHPAIADQLFQPFFSTKSTKGTGLGLWISNGIVQKYDGRIGYRSLNTGKGYITCFHVFLPGSRTFDSVTKAGAEFASANPGFSKSVQRPALQI